jgi:hypothetical protein
VGTTANTISRCETATYKPAISDLEKLARYFGVPHQGNLLRSEANTKD